MSRSPTALGYSPEAFVDPAVLQEALLQALAAGETVNLQAWMTNPVLTGWWLGKLADTSPAEASQLLAGQLGPQSKYSWSRGLTSRR